MGYIIFFISGVVILTSILNSCESKAPSTAERISTLEHRVNNLEQCIAGGNKDNPVCPQLDVK